MGQHNRYEHMLHLHSTRSIDSLTTEAAMGSTGFRHLLIKSDQHITATVQDSRNSLP